MSCDPLPPFYVPPTEVGLKIANSQSDGYIISLQWNKAYPQPYNYIVGYNIYFSSIKEDLFSEGPKYLAVNTLAVDLNDFIPGDTYFFAVRATQWSSDWLDFNSMPTSGDGYYYPEAFLLQDFLEDDTSIFLSDIDNFPNFGIIQVGGELIFYQNKDLGTSSLTGLTRGFLGTNIRSFDTTGYDGYTDWDPFIKIWSGIEEKNVKVFRETCDFAYPHFAYTSTDGYYNNPKDHLNTNLTNSDTTLVTIPSFDFSGYRSTNPKDLYQGKCVNSYFGGIIGCAADGYNLMPIRGGNVNDENLKRQELVLEQTARLGVLLQRSYTGIRCSCVMATSEHPDDRCPFCIGSGYILGFQQYFNPRRSDGRILVSVEPSEEDIPYQESGLENTFSPNAWTIAVPTIKDRDIIIFYDTYEPNLEDARFEVLNVSRNRVLYGVQGSQRFKLQRIRKTDAIYKISVNTDTSTIPTTLSTSITMAPGILPHSHEVIISGNNTLSITSINQLTQIGGANSSQYHNHQIINGVVQPAVGEGIVAHTHTLIFP